MSEAEEYEHFYIAPPFLPDLYGVAASAEEAEVLSGEIALRLIREIYTASNGRLFCAMRAPPSVVVEHDYEDGSWHVKGHCRISFRKGSEERVEYASIGEAV